MGSLLIIRTKDLQYVKENFPQRNPGFPGFQRLARLLLRLRFGHFRGKPPRGGISSSDLIPICITPLFYTLHFHTFFQQSQLKTQKIASFKIDLLFGRAHIQVPAKSFRECAAEGCCFNLFCACDIIARNLYHASLLGMASVPIWIFLPLIHPNKLERAFYKKHPSST